MRIPDLRSTDVSSSNERGASQSDSPVEVTLKLLMQYCSVVKYVHKDTYIRIVPFFTKAG